MYTYNIFLDNYARAKVRRSVNAMADYFFSFLKGLGIKQRRNTMAMVAVRERTPVMEPSLKVEDVLAEVAVILATHTVAQPYPDLQVETSLEVDHHNIS